MVLQAGSQVKLSSRLLPCSSRQPQPQAHTFLSLLGPFVSDCGPEIYKPKPHKQVYSFPGNHSLVHKVRCTFNPDTELSTVHLVLPIPPFPRESFLHISPVLVALMGNLTQPRIDFSVEELPTTDWPMGVCGHYVDC